MKNIKALATNNGFNPCFFELGQRRARIENQKIADDIRKLDMYRNAKAKAAGASKRERNAFERTREFDEKSFDVFKKGSKRNYAASKIYFIEFEIAREQLNFARKSKESFTDACYWLENQYDLLPDK